MNVTAKIKYACLGMLELASQHGIDKPVRIREIAQRNDIPERFLVQILLQLKRAGLIGSTRGAAGGYSMTKPPEEVSLGQVVAAVVSPPEEDAHAGENSAAGKVLTQTWQQIAAVEQEMLHSISLADLLDRIRSKDKQMYYI